MSQSIPLRLSIAPLTPGFEGTPQDLVTAIEENTTIVTDQALSLFVVGSTAPTSNQGPFFLNGTTLYVWSQYTGSYVPQILPPETLRYTISTTAPTDNTAYDVWYKLDSASTPVGSPLGTYLWYNGAWTPIGLTQAYLTANYYTQAQVDAAIAAAKTTSYAFKYVKQTASQVVPPNNITDTLITFETSLYDSGSAFASSVFTAPINGVYHFNASCAIGLGSGSPTFVTMPFKIRKNTIIQIEYNDNGNTGTGFRTNTVNGDIRCSAGDTIDVVQAINCTGASTWTAANDPTKTSFSGFLVQTI